MPELSGTEELRDIATIVAGVGKRINVAIIMSDDQQNVAKTNVEQALIATGQVKKRLEEWLCENR